MTEKDLKELVKQYQETGDQDAFNKLYEFFLPYIKSKSKRVYYVHDIDGILNERFLWCVINFKHDNPSFVAFVNMYFGFDASNAIGRHKRNKAGAMVINAKGNREVMDSNTTIADVDLVQNSVPYDDWNTVDNEMFLEQLFEKYKINEKEQYIIKLMLAGYRQKDIYPTLGISQSRISSQLKYLTKKQPVFTQHFKKYLLERNEKNYTV